ncbi:hypothetical protein Q4534_00450 [Cyclobacterium sp. 1_MG-2023]|uniref:hypothetical protein n=1 Tax=Cyclobacterium sp. 1_MG-2023 TaxID=3062681 RepID=UPI0026E2407F|nr:hypothetical protein [Cyclobacterium sp. 1_MG-2023]MDO6435848.1 hypothetical protein [Cyclobacterium sp. 1_MG-2023]
MSKVKDKLIDQITSLNDEELLESISNMVSQLSADGTIELSEEVQQELEKRSAEIKKGNFMTNEDFVKRFNK